MILAQCIVQAEIPLVGGKAIKAACCAALRTALRGMGLYAGTKRLRKDTLSLTYFISPFVKRPQNPCRHPTISCHHLVARKARSAKRPPQPPNQPLFQHNLPHSDIRADDFSRVQRAVPVSISRGKELNRF